MNDFARTGPGHPYHLIAEARGSSVVTLCGLTLDDIDRVDDSEGTLCKDCARKAG